MTEQERWPFNTGDCLIEVTTSIGMFYLYRYMYTYKYNVVYFAYPPTVGFDFFLWCVCDMHNTWNLKQYKKIELQIASVV